MARTITDVVTEARIILNDELTPYRYEDSELLRYLNNSIAEIRRLRPDVFVADITAALPTFSVVDTTPYPLSDMYFPATVNYIVAMAEMREDQSAVDGRAATFLKMFMSQMKVA